MRDSDEPAEECGEDSRSPTDKSPDFLTRFYGSKGLAHLYRLSETRPIKAKTFQVSESEMIAEWIEDGQGVDNFYFAVNGLKPAAFNTKANKAGVAAGLALHVDVDDLQALDRIRAFHPSPTVVVFSGGGYQAFWKLRRPSADLARIERINATIAHALGGDKCWNIDRIMRLPGTLNVPNAKKRAAGRVPALAYVVEELTDWTRLYDLNDFEDPEPAASALRQPVAMKPFAPVGLDDLPLDLSELTRRIIQKGDDLERPIGSPNARFTSRSEALFRCACDLARRGWAAEKIAGVLCNPNLGISASVLEKRKPAEYALRQATRACAAASTSWPDVTKSGLPRSTLRNTMLGMQRLELTFAYDQFRYRKTVEGAPIQEYQGELSDDACAVLRNLIIERYGFDPGKDNTREAAQTLSVEHPFHPIREYLAGLRWDGVPRINCWLTMYLGAADTPLNSAIGGIVLKAAVRRVREPGTKFDSILVLEGAQGGGKSSAIKILAGAENFSDQDILTLDPKAQMEALEGVWLYEICELEGISRADTSKVKAFASRAVDQGRPAYARFKESRPRQTVFIGTTNDDKYLRDMTGNRRFWPVKVGTIDLASLAQDRDQLWAEAAYWEAKGEGIILDESLWPLAQIEQEARLEDDPWLDKLSQLEPRYHDQVAGFVRAPTTDLLEREIGLPPERQQQFHTKRLAGVMRKIGWEGPMLIKMEDGRVVRGYQRPLSAWGDPLDPQFKRVAPKF